MRNDEVYRAAVSDPLIMQFAHKLTIKHYSDASKHDHVRCKITELGHQLLQLKKDGISEMADAVDPLHFQKAVSRICGVCGFDHEKNTFSSASLALKLGHSLKKCTMSVIAEALQTTNKTRGKGKCLYQDVRNGVVQ